MVFTFKGKDDKLIAYHKIISEVSYQMFSKLSIPLDIPDVRVLDVKMNKKGDYIIPDDPFQVEIV